MMQKRIYFANFKERIAVVVNVEDTPLAVNLRRDGYQRVSYKLYRQLRKRKPMIDVEVDTTVLDEVADYRLEPQK